MIRFFEIQTWKSSLMIQQIPIHCSGLYSSGAMINYYDRNIILFHLSTSDINSRVSTVLHICTRYSVSYVHLINQPNKLPDDVGQHCCYSSLNRIKPSVKVSLCDLVTLKCNIIFSYPPAAGCIFKVKFVISQMFTVLPES